MSLPGAVQGLVQAQGLVLGAVQGLVQVQGLVPGAVQGLVQAQGLVRALALASPPGGTE